MHRAGFTLWELLCTLTVAGVALGLAAPEFRSFLLDSRSSADVDAFVAAVQLARSESAKRARPVVLCKSADRVRCGGGEIRYDAGWIVFVDEDGARPARRSAGEPLLFAHAPRMAGRIESNRALYEFRPYRRRSTNGTVTFCDERGAAAARAVIVSYTGRPRTSRRAPDGRPLTCGGPP
ncbi:MAG: GspH/FimT family pseudopilin [Gammaproteobacteria bacterium]|nr:GspH/FimT family pseudopilin [Gammaproteobacteria bacterium]